MTTNGRTLAAGVLIGMGAALSLGTAGQPANRQADRVLARLDRLEAALLKPESKLPEDPKRSVEAMLEKLADSTQRVEAHLAQLDGARLEELARRVESIHNSLLEAEVGRLADLSQRLRHIERQFDQLGPTGRLQDVVRDVEDLKRRLRADIRHDLSDNRRRLDDAAREIRDLENRVRRIESKIG